MRVAIYAGSLDPFTKGHLSILQGAAKVFDHVIVAIGVNSNKKPLFSLKEREEIIHTYLNDEVWDRRPQVRSFSGLLINFCREVRNLPVDSAIGADVPDSVSIVRGLRALSDLESEMAIADANRRLDPRIPTVFIPTVADLAYVSSSIVREIASHKPEAPLLYHYVNNLTANRLLAKFS